MPAPGNAEHAKVDGELPSILRPGTHDASKRQTAAYRCGVPVSSIEDIMPCTALQETMLAATMKRPGLYVQKRIFHITRDVDLTRLEKAWSVLVSLTPIVRARMFYLDDGTSCLAIVKDDIEWVRCHTPSAYEAANLQRNFEPGSPLTWVALIPRPGNDGHDLVWTMHHCLYDAWSFDLMLSHLESLYQPANGYEPPLPFTDFIQHTIECGSETSLQFWKTQLHGTTCQLFPTAPKSYEPTPDTVETNHFDDVQWDNISWSKDIIIRAALTLLLANRTGQDDVVFGVVSAGRKAPVQGVERMAFPTLATVPLRNRLSQILTLESFLQQLRDQRRSMYVHEHTGIQRIRHLGNDEAHCCLFQTLLVVQSGQESAAGRSMLLPVDGPDRRAGRLLNFATSALTFECEPQAAGLILHASYDSKIVSQESAVRLCYQLGHIVRSLCDLGKRTSEVLLGDVPILSPRDLHDIWRWNPAPPPLHDKCFDEIVLEVAKGSPQAPAVDAWDGGFSYFELDGLSNQVSEVLINAGLGRGSLVAICSQKSKWIPVAILGVLRSGAAFVTFDHSAPPRRVATILSNTAATYLLTGSPESLPALPDGMTCFDLRTLTMTQCSPRDVRSMSRSPSDIAYICFTSGSTGEPKGIVVQHAAASTNLSANADVYDLCATTRTLCYSSLAFDGFMMEIFCTLFRGGCLCIPSQEQIIDNSLPQFLKNMRVNTAFLTPAVLRQYTPAELPTIATLLCGGEAVSEDLAKVWAGKVKFFVVYGPTETVVMSLAHLVDTSDDGPPPIGKGIAARTWIVHPNNCDVLQTIGAVGELLVEGETLAQGYLGDVKRTDQGFLKNPPWLLRGFADGTGGRSGRVYKTGDLARYREDGSLEFCGRADTQVKIRGQRVELAEVEFHTRCSIPTALVKGIAVEYTSPRDGNQNVLLMFVVLSDNHLSIQSAAIEAAAHAQKGLTQRLSSYMIPTHLVITDSIPKTISGKVDRQKLKTLAKSIALTDMLPLSSSKTPHTGMSKQLPLSAMEKQMQELCASVVGREKDAIETGHSFLDVGGDSVLAMRLVGLARQHGIQLRTSDVLQNHTLAEIAQKAVRVDASTRGLEVIPPFSLLNPGSSSQADLKNELADFCSVEPSQILDAYPCTPFQGRVMTFGSEMRDSLVAHFIHRLDTGVDLEVLRCAIDAEQRANPLLRTRIVQHPVVGTIQVVVESYVPCQTFPSSEAFVENLPLQHVELGTPLASCSLIEDRGSAYLALIAHHAVFDGWSISLALERICTAYKLGKDATPDPPPQFQSYIRYLANIDDDSDRNFWQAQMKGCTGKCFPAIPASANPIHVTSVVTHEVEKIDWPSHSTPAANVRATLAILYATFSETSEALFCEGFTGRSVPVAGVESMTGPTLGMVPMRIVLRPDETVQEFVDRMARQAIETSPHAHLSRPQIREFNEDTNRGCDFTSSVLIQPAKSAENERDQVVQERVVLGGIGERRSQHLNALFLEVDLRPSGLKMTMRTDERVLSGPRCEKFGREFEALLRKIMEPQNRSVRRESLDMA